MKSVCGEEIIRLTLKEMTLKCADSLDCQITPITEWRLFYCILLLLLLTILALQQVMNFDNSTRVGKE